MNSKMERVVRPPAMGLEELKAILIAKYPQLARNPLAREGRYDCMEVFGQSRAITDGFETLGMKAVSFDCSSLAKRK